MSEDLHWAWTAPEVQQHPRKLVAVYKKRVVGVGLDQQAIVEQAAEKEKCPWWHIVVTVVSPDELFETGPDFVES
jgi:hypothetical protein